ncbi:agmatine deiminase family protein [bacterium]|nr:agmatine deiminase family protein [bacterium]
MPAEWEPHAATWLSWPHKAASWPGKLERIPPLWVEMVRHLVVGELVHLLVNDAAPAATVRGMLERAGVGLERVRLHEVPTDDAWMRDHGPTFITRGSELALVDWRYNAWGGKYPPWENDDRVPRAVAELLDAPRFEPDLVLEGGSIDVDGAGTLLTTEQCLLNPNRNPGRSRAEIEQALCDYLGARRVLWLGDGILGDDTDGHVDDLTRFVAPATVVTAVEEDPADPNHAPLQENLRRLRAMRDAGDRPLRLITLPMPAPVEYEGQRLPASYANFYIGNAVVLVPVFDCANDARALATLREVFPTRRVVGIAATDMVWGLGACHCVTQQQPAAPAAVGA